MVEADRGRMEIQGEGLCERVGEWGLPFFSPSFFSFSSLARLGDLQGLFSFSLSSSPSLSGELKGERRVGEVEGEGITSTLGEEEREEREEGMEESEELLGTTKLSMERERLRRTLVGLIKRRGEMGEEERGEEECVFVGDSSWWGDETVIPFKVLLMSATGDEILLLES